MASLSTAAGASTKTLKDRLNNRETLYGLFLLSFLPTQAEISGHADNGFVVVDMEHSHGNISQALSCLHALLATQTPAILRLPKNSPTWVKKALDVSPQGLLFPMINDPDWAKQALSYCLYPLGDIRGAVYPIVRALKYGIDEGYLGERVADHVPNRIVGGYEEHQRDRSR